MADPKLVVALEARLNKFEKTLKEAGVIAARETKAIEDNFNRMNPSFAGLRRAFLTIGSVIASANLVSQFRNMVAELGKIQDLADRAQVTTDFIQAIGFATQQAGGSMEDAGRAAARFGKELGEVGNKNSYLARLFRANGLEIAKFANDGAAAFDAFAKIVARARTPQEAMNMVAEVFGDRVGPKMLTTIQQIGRQGLPQFIEQMREAGHVLDESIIKKGDQIDDAWNALLNRLGNRFKSFIIDTVREWETLISAMTNTPGVEAIPAEGRPRITISKPSTNVPQSAPSTRLDDFKRQVAAIQKQIELLQKEAELIDATTAARERARIVILLETAAREANREAGLKNTEVTAKQRAEIERVADAYGKAAAAIEKANLPLRQFARESANVTEGLQTVGVNALKGFEDALINIGTQAKSAQEAFKEMTAAILQDLARLLIRINITGPLASLLSGGLPIPLRAAGGPVSASSPYIVGENGPELFVPRGAGQIVPNSVMSRGGMGGQQFTLVSNIDARGSTMSEARFHQILNERDNRIRREVIPLTREGRSRKIA